MVVAYARSVPVIAQGKRRTIPGLSFSSSGSTVHQVSTTQAHSKAVAGSTFPPCQYQASYSMCESKDSPYRTPVPDIA
eukprot:393911-Rhodomonas_salina.4